HAESLLGVLRQMLALTRPAGARVLVNSLHPSAWWHEADGVHLRSADLRAGMPVLAEPHWIGASTHNAEELAMARDIGARFAVLGPVLHTNTHPEAEPLGWSRFANLAADAGLPVFALGGQSMGLMPQAFSCGAHGIAGIRHLFSNRSVQ
nr:thiamine phosphate synthase [Pseudomonas sp.]